MQPNKTLKTISKSRYATLRFQSAMTPWLRSFFLLIVFDFVDCCELCRKNVHSFTATCFCQILDLEFDQKKRKKKDLLAYILTLSDSSGRQAVTHRLIVIVLNDYVLSILSTSLRVLLCCLCGFGLYNSCIVILLGCWCLVFEIKTRYPSRGLAGNSRSTNTETQLVH